MKNKIRMYFTSFVLEHITKHIINFIKNGKIPFHIENRRHNFKYYCVYLNMKAKPILKFLLDLLCHANFLDINYMLYVVLNKKIKVCSETNMF